MRRSLWLVAAVVGLAFGPVVAARAASPGDEARFLSLTNGARAQAGAPALRTAVDLVAFARHHSDEMAASGRLYHSSDLEGGVRGWEAVAENVGRGSSVDYVHQLFMQSATHRHNIVNPRYTEVGIGVTWRGDTLYVTEVFRQPVAAAPPATVPTTLAPAPPSSVRRAPARPAPTTTTAPPAPVPTVRLATTTTAVVLSSQEVDALAADPTPTVVQVAAAVPGEPEPVGPAAVAGALVVLLLVAHGRVRYSLR